MITMPFNYEMVLNCDSSSTCSACIATETILHSTCTRHTTNAHNVSAATHMLSNISQVNSA
jgi:positive regulator of sigma E activity